MGLRSKQKVPFLLPLLIASAGMNLLWYKRVMIAISFNERMFFVAACGLGVLSAALLLDAQRQRFDNRSVVIVFCIGGIAFTALALAPGFLHILSLVLAGLFSGGSFLILIIGGCRILPSRYRGRAFAFSFLFAGIINTATDLVELPLLHVQGAAPNLIMGSLCMALCLALMLWKGQALNPRAIPIMSEERSETSQMVRIGTLAILCFLLLYTSLSLKESVAYPSAITTVSAHGFIRFIEIPLWLIAGFVTDMLGRRVLLGVSLICAFVGAAGTLVSESESVTALATLCTYFCQIGFPTACVALLVDVSFYMRRPSLLGFFAFAPLILGQLLQGVALLLLEGVPNDTLFIADILILALFSALAIWLFSLVSASLAFFRATADVIRFEGQVHGVAAPTQIAADYGLTKREQEILVLIIANKTVRQMATELYVSESTVKFHITNILKKTDSSNRAVMLEKLER